MVRRWLIRLALVAVLAAGGGTAALYVFGQRYLASPGPSTAEVVVDLPRGAGVRSIAARLAEAGAIEHPWAFAALARATGRDRRLKAGEYAVPAGLSPSGILDLLESGKVLLHPVAVPEGLTVREVFAILEAAEVLAGDLPPLPPEGSLLPETYLVERGHARAALVARMEAAMAAELERAWAARAPDLPLASPAEALALASIIEKETALPEEYPVVAAVFVNRLRRGMRLQTDPTVIFALTEGKAPLGRELTRADLEVDHPYNTYRISGLPPGPIAAPGRGAIAAAVRPADVDYLYFVADGAGGHAFARTLDEHNRNVRRWRRLRDAGGG